MQFSSSGKFLPSGESSTERTKEDKMTVEEAIEIWKKTKSPYLKRDMEKFIHRHKKKSQILKGVKNENRKQKN